jgi:hypothetical protein
MASPVWGLALQQEIELQAGQVFLAWRLLAR